MRIAVGFGRQTHTNTHTLSYTHMVDVFWWERFEIELKMVLYDYSNYNYYKYNIITNVAVQ